jgi:hypothetical protein
MVCPFVPRFNDTNYLAIDRQSYTFGLNTYVGLFYLDLVKNGFFLRLMNISIIEEKGGNFSDLRSDKYTMEEVYTLRRGRCISLNFTKETKEYKDIAIIITGNSNTK